MRSFLLLHCGDTPRHDIMCVVAVDGDHLVGRFQLLAGAFYSLKDMNSKYYGVEWGEGLTNVIPVSTALQNIATVRVSFSASSNLDDEGMLTAE